jgi:arginase
MFEMYGCPTHYGHGDRGLIQSIDYLTENYENLKMNKISEITMPEEWHPNMKNLNSVIATCNNIAAYASDILKSGKRPLMIAGDHSSAMGSVSGYQYRQNNHHRQHPRHAGSSPSRHG